MDRREQLEEMARAMGMTVPLPFQDFEQMPELVKAVSVYCPSKEAKIPHDWWTIDAEATQALLKDISNNITSIIPKLPSLDQDLQHVLRSAMGLLKLRVSDPIRVAFIGLQGVGKSSAINSVLGIPGLTLIGANGSACTAAVVIYAYAPSEGFAAKVKFLRPSMRNKVIKQYVASLVAYKNDLGDEEDEDDSELTPEDREFAKKEKDTAEEFFESIFGGNDSFLTNWNASKDHKEFRDICEAECKRVVSDCCDGEVDSAVFTANRPEDLATHIAPFLGNVKDKQCLWPLVESVKIRLDHPLLEQGLEIIDLPGAGDINSARTRHVEAVRENADVEIILGNCSRIATDEQLISMVQTGVKYHGVENVRVVATHTDVVSNESLSKATGEMYTYINKLLETSEELICEAEDIEDDTQKALKTSKLRQHIDYLRRARQQYFILTRIDRINSDLRPRIKDEASGKGVQIHHTSTDSYMKWITDVKGKGTVQYHNQPVLGPQQTGIPDLIKFLYNLPASKNLEDFRHHIENTLGDFVEKLKRVVKESEGDDDFGTIANAVDKDIEKHFTALVDDLKAKCVEYSSNALRKALRDMPGYKAAVKTLVTKWTNLPWSSFTRLLKSRGYVAKGKSKAHGLENGMDWNAELANCLKPVFEEWFQAFKKSMATLHTALTNMMTYLHHSVQDVIRRTLVNTITEAAAQKPWAGHRVIMQTRAGSIIEELKSEHEKLLWKVTLENDTRNNLVSELMDPIYNSVLTTMPPKNSANSKKFRGSVSGFRKKNLMEALCADNNHIIDHVLDLFKDTQKRISERVIQDNMGDLRSTLQDYSEKLRIRASINFEITAEGGRIRSELAEVIPSVEKQADGLKTMLPCTSDGDGDSEAPVGVLDPAALKDMSLGYFLRAASREASKRKQSFPAGRVEKKVKTELF